MIQTNNFTEGYGSPYESKKHKPKPSSIPEADNYIIVILLIAIITYFGLRDLLKKKTKNYDTKNKA